MSSIESIVDSLEGKINKILNRVEVLQKENVHLQADMKSVQQKVMQKDAIISSWEEKYESLKFANSILGSDESKREAKLKINTLIREIDHCISQLSE